MTEQLLQAFQITTPHHVMTGKGMLENVGELARRYRRFVFRLSPVIENMRGNGTWTQKKPVLPGFLPPRLKLNLVDLYFSHLVDNILNGFNFAKIDM